MPPFPKTIPIIINNYKRLFLFCKADSQNLPFLDLGFVLFDVKT